MLRAPSQAESFELISLIFFYRGLDVVSRRRKPLMPPLVLLPSLRSLPCSQQLGVLFSLSFAFI
jgi:hypothetical protein